jgi:exoribonuclease-2
VLDARGPLLAVVESSQGSRLRLRLGFEARQSVLPQRLATLLMALPAGHEPALHLEAPPWNLTPDRLSQAAPPRRAWGAAWQLLLEAQTSITLPEFTELVYGSDQPIQRAACWLEVVSPASMFRIRPAGISARPTAELRAQRRDRRRRQLQEGRERDWLVLLKRRQPLELSQLTPEQRDRLHQLQHLAAGHLEPRQLDPALHQSLVSLHLGFDRGDVRHLLADLGQWDRHQLLSLNQSSWREGFPPQLLEEAARLHAQSDQPHPSDESRLDLCGQRIVTIDDDDTLDLDDGLAIERFPDGRARIWIHVADPGRLVAVDSPLDLEARRRGSSLYLARGVLPMFPHDLSTGPFSLRQGVRTAAWSVWVELDGEGGVSCFGVHRSWVKVRYRLSYRDADELIELAPPEDPDLAELHTLLQKRHRWRLQRGALVMDLPEGRIRCRDGAPCLEITEPGPARRLVAEAMILTGCVAASYGQAHDLPLPYRSQLPAQLPTPQELAGLPDGPVRFAAIKRCLSRGLTGFRPAAHFSLGVTAYVQATSPIRRYGDLVVQRQINAHLSGAQPMTEAELEHQLQNLDTAVREGITIGREDQRHWLQVWFETQRVGQWRGQFLRWLRPQDNLGLIWVEDLAMDLAAECPRGLNPGEFVLLRVHQIDDLRDQLRLICSIG